MTLSSWTWISTYTHWSPTGSEKQKKYISSVSKEESPLQNNNNNNKQKNFNQTTLYNENVASFFFFFSMKHSACFLPVVRLCVSNARFSESGFPLTRSLLMDFQLYRTLHDKQIMTLLLCGPSPSTVHCALCWSLRRLKTCKARVSVTEVFPLFFDDYLCLEDL